MKLSSVFAILWLQLISASEHENGLRGTNHGGIMRRSSRQVHVSPQIEHDFIEENLLKFNAKPFLQEISDDTFELDGEIISVNDDNFEAFEDVFTSDATFILDGKPQARLPPTSLFRNKDKNITIAKDGDQLLWAFKMTAHGKPEEVFPISFGSHVFATVIASDDVDEEKFSKKFNHEDAIPEPGGQGHRLVHSLDVQNHRSLATACTKYDIIELALAFDTTFCAAYGYDEQASTRAATNVVAEASSMFGQEGLCMKIKISYMEGSCNGKGPFDEIMQTTDHVCNSGLEKFRRFWFDHRSDVKRDVTFWFYGESARGGTSMIGCAYRGGLCRSSLGYGAVEVAHTSANPFYGPTDFAHELAHSCGATHDCDSCSSGFLMSPSSCHTCDTFSPYSIEQIKDYVGSNAVMCIDPEQCSTDTDCVDAQDKCNIGSCTQGSCVFTQKSCDDQDRCTDDRCDSRTGRCINTFNTQRCSPQTAQSSCRNKGQSCSRTKKCCQGCRCVAKRASRRKSRRWWRRRRRVRQCRC